MNHWVHTRSPDLVLDRGREQAGPGPAQVAQPEGDAAAGALALGRLVEPRRRVPLDEHAAVVAHMVPARRQEPPPEVVVVGVDQERGQQHGVEPPPQVELLDPRLDGLGPDEASPAEVEAVRPAPAIPVSSAPRTRASISADSSTATTGWPSATSRWVIRPAPAPSSRIEAPAGSRHARSRVRPWPAAARRARPSTRPG